MIKCLVIPDVHGRTFWRDAIKRFPKEQHPDLKIIFLGDYMDPYYMIEDIDDNMAFEVFTEIIDLAKSDDRVQLLLGNHDWHYIHHTDSSRINFDRYDEIKTILIKNFQLFKICERLTIKDKTFVFSHAGILRGWVQSVKSFCQTWLERDVELPQWQTDFLVKMVDDLTMDNAPEMTNEMMSMDEFKSCGISMISRNRGGRFSYGSPIWADAWEHVDACKEEPYEYYQVFGHTLGFPKSFHDSLDEYFINDPMQYAMLDSRQAFVIDENAKIIALKDIEEA